MSSSGYDDLLSDDGNNDTEVEIDDQDAQGIGLHGDTAPNNFDDNDMPDAPTAASISGESDVDNDSDQDTEIGFAGPASAWKLHTEAERGLITSLNQQRANDLSVHLYNTFALKARASGQDGSPQADDSGSRKRQKRNDGSSWKPREGWTAWPLMPSDVPRPGEDFGAPLDYADDDGTYGCSRPWHPGADLEDEVQALMLRAAISNYRERQKRNPNATLSKHLPDEQQLSRSLASGNGAAESDQISDGAELPSVPAAAAPKEVVDLDFVLDDEDTEELLVPHAQRIISKLDDLLEGLHKSRQSRRRSKSQSRSTASPIRKASQTPGARRSARLRSVSQTASQQPRELERGLEHDEDDSAGEGSEEEQDKSRTRSRTSRSVSNSQTPAPARSTRLRSASQAASQEPEGSHNSRHSAEDEEEDTSSRQSSERTTDRPRSTRSAFSRSPSKSQRASAQPVSRMRPTPGAASKGLQQVKRSLSRNEHDGEDSDSDAYVPETKGKSRTPGSEIDDLISEPQNEKSREGSKEPKKKEWRLGTPRDWTDILRTAALVGWDRDVISRAATRCSALFGEEFAVDLPNNKADRKVPNLEFNARGPRQLFGEEPVMSFSNTKGGNGKSSKAVILWACPIDGCKRYNKPFEKPFRWREHLTRTHKFDKGEIRDAERKMKIEQMGWDAGKEHASYETRAGGDGLDVLNEVDEEMDHDL